MHDTDIPTSLQGGCRCGAVRYEIAADALPPTYACHCLDCQTWTGAAFSQQFVVREEDLHIHGPLTLFELTPPSGRVSRQRACGTCFTRVYNTNSARPGIAAIRAGSLDASDRLQVVAHIWTKRKQPWIILPDSVPQWHEAAPAEQLFGVLGVSGEVLRRAEPKN